MKRRTLLKSAAAIPLLTIVESADARQESVLVAFSLPFNRLDGRLCVRDDGCLHTPIGDKLQKAVERLLAADPRLKPDLTRKVSFDLLQADGTHWGRPGPVMIAARTVFRTGPWARPWMSPRNAIAAKGLASKDATPALRKLDKVLVKAFFTIG